MQQAALRQRGVPQALFGICSPTCLRCCSLSRALLIFPLQVINCTLVSADGKVDQRWKELMKFQIARARQYFSDAEARLRRTLKPRHPHCARLSRVLPCQTAVQLVL